MLALVKVPKHGDAILSTGRSERTVGGDGHGVDVAGVTVVVGLELELRKLPNLVICKTLERLSNVRPRDEGKGSEILVIKISLIGCELSEVANIVLASYRETKV